MLGVTSRVAERVGSGKHRAFIVARPAQPGSVRIVYLASKTPITAGVVFTFDGRAWRVDRELGGDETGMWEAVPVE